MSVFTRELRQEIVREFALRHGGVFSPAAFVEEVRRVGETHAAHDWFEWDRDRAAFRYQVEQAREFARDLRVVFTVEEVGPRSAIRVRTAAMPLVLSPVAGRKDGGGYLLVDPSEPEHMAEHCRQAATALRAWINRYGFAVTQAGGSTQGATDLVGLLEASSIAEDDAA